MRPSIPARGPRWSSGLEGGVLSDWAASASPPPRERFSAARPSADRRCAAANDQRGAVSLGDAGALATGGAERGAGTSANRRNGPTVASGTFAAAESVERGAVRVIVGGGTIGGGSARRNAPPGEDSRGIRCVNGVSVARGDAPEGALKRATPRCDSARGAASTGLEKPPWIRGADGVGCSVRGAAARDSVRARAAGDSKGRLRSASPVGPASARRGAAAALAVRPNWAATNITPIHPRINNHLAAMITSLVYRTVPACIMRAVPHAGSEFACPTALPLSNPCAETTLWHASSERKACRPAFSPRSSLCCLTERALRKWRRSRRGAARPL